MPTIPSPDPAGLPAPAWLLQVLLVLTFVFHVLAMNLLVGGVVFMGLALRRAKKNPFFATLAGRLSKALPACMAMTITLGIAPLLFLQVLYGQAYYTTTVLMAWPWLAIIPLLIVAYYGLYVVQFNPEWLGGRTTPVAWASALIILFIGLLFTSNSVLIQQPERWAELYGQSTSGLRLEVAGHGLWMRWAHMILGGFAVSGLGLGLLAKLYAREDPEWSAEATAYGARWFVGATAANLVVGLGFLFSIPEPMRSNFMGSNLADTAVLWVGVAAGVGAMHFAMKRQVGMGSAMVAVAIALMAISRQRLRAMYLESTIDPSTMKVDPQWDVFVVFALLLVAGLGVVIWMLRTFAKGEPGASSDLNG